MPAPAEDPPAPPGTRRLPGPRTDPETGTAPDASGPDGGLPDARALSRWLDEQRLHDGPVELTPVTGGSSHRTYTVDGGTRTWVLRMPLAGGTRSAGQDLAREYRVISALVGTAVPVPAPVALCTDPAVLGAAFVLTDAVDGIVVRSRIDVARYAAPQRHALGLHMVDVLVDLHAVDVEAVGLGGLDRPEGFLLRRLKRCGQQLDRSRSRQVPGIDLLKVRLASGVPARRSVALVHGNYRLDNLVLDPEDARVLAVLGWEAASVGDPLTDVGFLLALTTTLDTGSPAAAGLGPRVGFPPPGELVDRYARTVGLDDADLAVLPWCTALGCFQLAVALEAVHRRRSKGEPVGPGLEHVGDLVPDVVARGLAVLDDPALVRSSGRGDH